MMELCCSHSIVERTRRAQLLLFPGLRLSPILYSANFTLLPESPHAVEFKLTTRVSPRVCWLKTRQFAKVPKSTTSIAQPGSNALPGYSSLLAKGGRL